MDEKALIHFYKTIRFAGLAVLLLWSIHILSWLTGYSFANYGVYPRKLYGLTGILTAPLVHGDLQHIFSNSFPFFFLTAIIYYFYRKVAVPAFVIIYILTGFTVWLFARPVHHIGASGVVYGLMSFVLFSGIFRRNIKSIGLALAVTVFYSGYFYGLVPLKEGISWESHLYGALIGILVAYIFKGVVEHDEIHTDPWANDNSEQEYFLQRDTFEKTIQQRILEQQQKLASENEGHF